MGMTVESFLNEVAQIITKYDLGSAKAIGTIVDSKRNYSVEMEGWTIDDNKAIIDATIRLAELLAIKLGIGDGTIRLTLTKPPIFSMSATFTLDDLRNYG